MPMGAINRSYVALVLIVAAVTVCEADIFKFEKAWLQPGTPVMARVVAMYNAEDAPSDQSPGNGQSWIKLKFNFELESMEPVTGKLQLMILQAESLKWFGTVDDEAGEQYCCTEELQQLGVAGCDAPGQLIFQNDPEKPHEHKTIVVEFDNSVNAKIDGADAHYAINTTGQHILIISNCDSNIGSVYYSGVGEWMNPYGYLPGRLWSFLPFYQRMSMLFLALGLAWFVVSALHWQEIYALQNIITFVLVLCMAEVTTWYFDYNNLNNTGIRHVGAVVAAMLLSAARRSLSRMLILAVCLGWGVVKPSLGEDRNRILGLGFMYFLCEAALELIVRYGQTNSTGQFYRALLSVPVTALNACFYWRTFIALYRIIEQLKSRKQDVKAQLYQRFSKVLIAEASAAVIFALYEAYFMVTGQAIHRWTALWLLEGGFSLILYTVMMVAIAVLWRPSANSRRYAYSQVKVSNADYESDLDQEETNLNAKAVELSVVAVNKFVIDESDDEEDDASSKLQ